MNKSLVRAKNVHKLWLALAAVVLALASGAAGFLISQHSKFPVSNGPVTFEGKITSQVHQCGTDGECSITVRGQKIVNECGMEATICPLRVQPEVHVGQTVRITGIKYDDGPEHYFHLHCQTCGITVLSKE